MAQQFNDEQCRKADDPAHRCTDKFGAWFASPVRPARPGSTCWWETIQQLEDERALEEAALRRLAAASTLDDLLRPNEAEEAYVVWLDGWCDAVDPLESEEAR